MPPNMPGIGDDGGVFAFATQPAPSQVSSPNCAIETEDQPDLPEDSMAAMKRRSEVSHIVQVIRHGEDKSTQVRVSNAATIGQLISAEIQEGTLESPIKATNSVGRLLGAHETTRPYQQIFLRRACDADRMEQSQDAPAAEMVHLGQYTRKAILYQQLGWVANDEFTFYLNMIASPNGATTVDPLINPSLCRHDNGQLDADQWVGQVMEALHPTGIVITGILHDKHWVPICAKVVNERVKITTVPEGKELCYHLFQDWADPPGSLQQDISVSQVLHKFDFDCGFQAIGWLQHHARQDEFNPSEAVPGVDPRDAVVWRHMFEHDLQAKDLFYRIPACDSITFGGALDADLPRALQQLLEAHGVPTNASEERAKIVVDKLGRSAVHRALRSGNPWGDLKQVSNQQTPKLQLVLGTELEETIRQRVGQDKPFGNRRKKEKGTTPPKTQVQLQPHDLTVPTGIFVTAATHHSGKLTCKASAPKQGVSS